jgi:hypothetical protein
MGVSRSESQFYPLMCWTVISARIAAVDSARHHNRREEFNRIVAAYMIDPIREGYSETI